jgi:hypothetical protein
MWAGLKQSSLGEWFLAGVFGAVWFAISAWFSPAQLILQQSSRQREAPVIPFAYLQSCTSRRLILASFLSFRLLVPQRGLQEQVNLHLKEKLKW